MATIEERYISLLTDFGFKRIFGTAPNKELLINFLNSLFDGKQVIKDVKYLNTEHFGDNASARKAIFDVYCEGDDGEKFIVEMQNAYQDFFKDRSLFYSTFPIREQAKKSAEWDFKLSRVYTVALLNFDMKEDAFDKKEITHTVKLCDIKNSIDSARREGRAEGRAEGHAEEKKVIARKMKSKGFSAADISEMTGLTDEEIETL